MVNPTSINSSPSRLLADTPAQKRALSYATTIKMLFDEVMQNHQPADRILANYFREHKKHGSKDRKVIRETLFGVFRWWGWLKKLPQIHSDDVDANEPLSPQWFAILSGCGLLENHPWQDIRQAWQGFGNLTLGANPQEADTVIAKQALLTECFPQLNFEADELLPAWFWQICPVDEDDKASLITAMSSRPPIWARAQGISSEHAAKQLQRQGIDASAGHYFTEALNLGHKSMNLNEVALYKSGQLEIQDLASQVIGQICAPDKDQQWWDACSGAGGKTLQMRSMMLARGKGQGSIIASDIRSHALEELNKRAHRAKLNGISIARWKSDALPVPVDHFDGVLVDAPCSCTGTWRRNPDMRWIDGVESVEGNAKLQLDILSRSSKAVKAGGVLVYATCSLSPIENQDVVDAFLAEHPEFTLQMLTHPFTGKQATMLTVWPFEANSDGMFVVRMLKNH